MYPIFLWKTKVFGCKVYSVVSILGALKEKLIMQ